MRNKKKCGKILVDKYEKKYLFLSYIFTIYIYIYLIFLLFYFIAFLLPMK